MDIRKYHTRADMEIAHQKEVNNFPMVFAFDRETLKRECLKVFDLDIDEPGNLKQLVGIGGGGVIRRSDIKAFNEMFERQKEEKKAFTKDFNNLVAVIVSAMRDHEYSYTMDKEDVLIELSAYTDNLRFDEAWRKAEEKVLRAS